MKNRIIASIAIIWTAAFLQSTLLEYTEIFSVRPNLMIVLMVITALLRSPFESMIMAIGFGLCMDMLMGKTLGWYGLLFFFTALPISLINEKIYRDKFIVLVTFTFASTVIIETFFYLILFLFRGYSDLPYVFVRTVLPEGLYNSILVLPLFKPISRVYSILDTVDRRRNRI
jgi:rod shape-determining protein MreD